MAWIPLHDVRFGLRLLARKPALTLVAVTVLAIGIGANTTVFSVVDSVLLEPLDHPEADRLVQVWERNQHTGERSWVYYGNYLDWRERSRTFDALAIYNLWELSIWGDPEPERIKTLWVTASYFPMLGVEPALGRVFTAEEEAPGKNRVAVISHGLWQRRFGGDPGVVGKPLQITESTAEVIGVLPPSFGHPGSATLEQPEIFIPNVVWEGRESERSGYTWEQVLGRLAPGADLASAGREMSAIAIQLASEHPDTNAQRGVTLEPLSHHVVGDLRLELRFLMVAVGLVLILVCANVSSLVTVRSAGRRQEMAVRSALGAHRSRLIRQLVVESALLAVAGGTLGLLLSTWAVAALRNQASWDIPRLDEVAVDATSVIYAGVAMGIGIVLFGLVPAMSALRKGTLTPHLKAGGRGLAPGQQHLQRALVVGEVALALTLVVGAGLVLRSYREILDADPGFRPERAVSVSLSQAGSRYDEPGARVQFWDELLRRLRAQPGIRAAGAVTVPPLLSQDATPTVYQVEGREPPPSGQEATAQLQVTAPGYLEALGLTVLEGRSLDERDRPGSQGVVTVNRSLANRLAPGGSPIGKRLRLPGREGSWWLEDADDGWLTIVGVIADVRRFGLDAAPVPEIHRPFAQEPWMGMTLVVRGDAAPSVLYDQIRREARAVDSNQSLRRFITMADVYDRSLGRRRLLSGVLAGFAGVALVLATIGIYGLMAWSVSQRTQEIGLRMAVGARASDILRMILAHAGRLIAFGLVLGVPLAGMLTRITASLLFGISGLDLPTWSAAILVLSATAFLAGLVPAWRATRVDPQVALRHD